MININDPNINNEEEWDILILDLIYVCQELKYIFEYKLNGTIADVIRDNYEASGRIKQSQSQY